LPRLLAIALSALATTLLLPAGAGAASPDAEQGVRAKPLAHASAFVPDDPGSGATPGGWKDTQWNFVGPYGVDALGAWRHLIAKGRPGGVGVTVAVLDTGVAYRTSGSDRKSPDLRPARFVRGYDFVDGDDRPTDRNGHGTHVASTIAEATDNGIGVTGLAYGVRIMPVRVLGDDTLGSKSNLSRGIRWAVTHGADIINVSFNVDAYQPATEWSNLLAAVRAARAAGVLVVAASGNENADVLGLPARSRSAIAVAASTEHGCLSDYANTGSGLDLVAPGGGADADLAGDPRCDPDDDGLRDIFQVTLEGPLKDRFGLPGGYEGTSMAAPHVSAAAALVIASGVLGRNPTPAAVQQRLQDTARDLGAPGYDRRYGWGLLDAAAATRPGPPVRRSAPPAPATPGLAPPAAG